MARTARTSYLSNYYHIIVQGDEKKFIFKHNSWKEKYIYFLFKNAHRNNIKILAYCVMDNHVHILIYTSKLKSLSKMMQQTGTSYGRYFSKIRNNVGHVFRERYKSEPILNKNYLINCIKYIHSNPVKANIVKECYQYEYSSYTEYNDESGCFINIKSLKILESVDLADILKGQYNSELYIEKEKIFEDIQVVLSELNLKYDFSLLNQKQIVEIFNCLKERCNISKKQFFEIFKISPYKLNIYLKSFMN